MRGRSELDARLDEVLAELRHEFAQARARGVATKLRVATSGLAALGLLPPSEPARVAARLELGGSVEEELRRLVDSVVGAASPSQRPLLLDAHVILTAALGQAGLARPARGVLERLRRAGQEESQRRAQRGRLAAVLAQMERRGALAATDVASLLSGTAGEEETVAAICERLRARAQLGVAPPELRVQAARWGHALEDLFEALAPGTLQDLVAGELLRVEVQELRAGAGPACGAEDRDYQAPP